MIYKLYASDPRFKSVDFQPGLNVIIADRKEESSDKDSRNGLGKTTFINIMHFCLGADLNKKDLPIEKIEDWIFFMELEIYGEKITASRSINNPNIVKIQGNPTNFPINVEQDSKDQFQFYKISDWKVLLGMCLFGLPATPKAKYSPTFRNLISYFIRSGIDAYSKPFSYFRGQPAWSIQVHNAFLLGLNWELASTAQEIKDKSKVVNSLNSAIKLEIEPSKGELEAERIHLQLEFDKDKASLSKFEVHPQYQELQKQANYLTEEIHALSNKNLMLQRKLTRYEESIQSEQVPNESSVEQIYKEAGLYFGSALKKTLNEAKTFHTEIIQNRKDFLKVEIEAIKNQIQTIDADVKILTSKRSKLMTILQSHGALEEFTILQERLLEKKVHLEKIKFKITTIEETSLRKKEIKAAKIELETKLQRDYEQSRSNWEKAIAIFNENSLALYNEPGNLIINLSENGYSFDVEIPRSNSEGVGKMKIFCYDLMLVDLFSKDGKINFLVHDSTMFDGVDSRQIARAIEHAHQKSMERGFQYICVFNSNMIPEKDFDSNFKIDNFIRLTLKDQDPKDSLLGFRF